MAEQVESIKWVPNSDFLVDGFRFQSPRCSSHFLTHYHGDHTCGAALRLVLPAADARCHLFRGALQCAVCAQAFQGVLARVTWTR